MSTVPAGFSVADAVPVDPVAYDGLHGFMAPRRVTTTCAEASAVPANGVLSSGCGGPTGFAPGLPELTDIAPDDAGVAEHRTLGAYHQLPRRAGPGGAGHR